MDLYGFTVGGGAVTNPGRYLVLVPPTLVDAGSTYALTDIAQSGPYRERVGWLRCFRRIDTLTAILILAELHDFRRFHSPRCIQLRNSSEDGEPILSTS